MSYLKDYYNQTPRPGQEFGAPRDNGKRTHQGADFSHSTKPGTVNVPSVETGKVTGNYWSDGYGWRLEIGPWSYSHLEHQSHLKVGATCQAGTIVGTEGDTGSTSGSCMHIEYVSNGKKVDPVPVIREKLNGTSAETEQEEKESTLKMHEALIVHKETNKLIIVNLEDKTLIDLGSDENSGLRAYYANNFPWSIITEPEWTTRFEKYKYI